MAFEKTVITLNDNDEAPVKKAVLNQSDIGKLVRSGTFKIVAYPNASISAVWKKFGLLQEEGSEKPLPWAICRSCKTLYSFKGAHSSGTSSLSRHACTAEPAKNGQKHLTKYLESLENLKPVPTAAKAAMTDACASFTAKDLRAFNAVSGEGFLDVIKTAVSLERRFDFSLDLVADLIPHRTTVGKSLGEKASEIRMAFGIELQSGEIYTKWSIDCLIGLVFQVRFDWLMAWLIDRLIDWSIYLFFSYLLYWLINKLTCAIAFSVFSNEGGGITCDG